MIWKIWSKIDQNQNTCKKSNSVLILQTAQYNRNSYLIAAFVVEKDLDVCTHFSTICLQDSLIKDANLEGNPHVLMVSHGVFLVEFFIVLFKELGCQPPPNATKEDLKKTASNTSWSRFEFEINPDFQLLKLKCLQLWTEDHLEGL